MEPLHHLAIPSTIDDFRSIPDEVINFANSWLIRDEKNPPHSIIVHGQAGTGKTTMLRALARDCGFHLIEINAAMDRDADMVSKFRNIPLHDLFGNINMLLLDEVDNMKNMVDIEALIMHPKYPIAMTANSMYRIPYTIKKQLKAVKLYRPMPNTLYNELVKITAKFNLNPPDSLLRAASETRDFRMAYKIIESGIISQYPDNYNSMVDITASIFNNTFDPTKTPIKPTSIKTLISYIHHNTYPYYDRFDRHTIYNILSEINMCIDNNQYDFIPNLLKSIPGTCFDFVFIEMPPNFKAPVVPGSPRSPTQ